MKKRILYVSIGVLTILVASVAGFFIAKLMLADNKPAEEVVVDQSEEVETVPRLKFSAMGDMLAHDSVVNNARVEGGYDFTAYFAKVKHLYQNSDVIFCNPETPVAGDALGVSGYPSFNAPKEFARDLSATGCNMINLATNHIYDRRMAGIEQSLEVWQSHKPLAMAGAYSSLEQSNEIAYFTKNGIKVAFLAFMDFSNSAIAEPYAVASYHDVERTKEKLQTARANADVVIVSSHWGVEGSTVPSGAQRQIAQMYADAGVDVVIGTGPHVLQSVEYIETENKHKTLVWYSIGNMLSSQLQLNELTGGVASFEIVKDGDAIKIEKVGFAPTMMLYSWPLEDRRPQILETRTNLMLYPLAEASAPLESLFPGETVESRSNFARETLGETVEIHNKSAQ